MNKNLLVYDLGRMPYAEALAIQRRLLEKRQLGEIADTRLS